MAKVFKNGNILKKVYMEYVGSNSNIETAAEFQAEKA